MRITIKELRRVIREVVEAEQGNLFPGDPAMVPKAHRRFAAPLPPEGFELETQVYPDGQIGSKTQYGDRFVTGVYYAKSTSGPLKRIKYDPHSQKWVDMPEPTGRYTGQEFDRRTPERVGYMEGRRRR